MANITPERNVSAHGRNFQAGVTYSVDDETAAAVEEALVALEAVEADMADAVGAAPSEDGKTADEAQDAAEAVVDGTIPEVVPEIEAITDPAELDAVREAELAGHNRKGVLDAVDHRRAQLEADADNGSAPV
jgi:hypothetical protein